MSLLRPHLTAIRANAAAVVAMVDALLADPPTPPRDPTAPCVHPPESRLAAARMGQPNAWVCGTCGMESESP